METKKLSASQAKAITIQNQKPIEKICHDIQLSAEAGDRFRIFHEYISMPSLAELMKLGYSIKENIGPVGETLIIVSWA